MWCLCRLYIEVNAGLFLQLWLQHRPGFLLVVSASAVFVWVCGGGGLSILRLRCVVSSAQLRESRCSGVKEMQTIISLVCVCV